MDIELDEIFIKEVRILAILSHLNLIIYYIVIKISINRSIKSYEIKEKKRLFVY